MVQGEESIVLPPFTPKSLAEFSFLTEAAASCAYI